MVIQSNLQRKRRMLDNLIAHDEETKSPMMPLVTETALTESAAHYDLIDDRVLKQWTSMEQQLPNVIACSDDESDY
jgi:hypothetical protein